MERLINVCHDDYSAGLCYEKGTEVAKNMQEAVRYYKLAADLGDSFAQYNLGESCAY
jgi:TPR repeat protein